MKKIVVVLLAFALVAFAAPAMAKTSFNLPATYTQDQFKKLSTDIGLAISYVPLAPAEPLGNKLPGFDIGVEATSVNIDRGASYWQDAGVDIPSSLVFPKGQRIEAALPCLTSDGSLFVHLDYREVHYVRWH